MKADKASVTRLIKTARGQLDGILNMIEQDRYCLDISNQLLATQAILNKVNKQILHAHMEHCVKSSMNDNTAPAQKIDEMMALIDKMLK